MYKAFTLISKPALYHKISYKFIGYKKYPISVSWGLVRSFLEYIKERRYIFLAIIFVKGLNIKTTNRRPLVFRNISF